MNSSSRCPVAGCGETGVLSSPHHDPFAPITFELLGDREMERACAPHGKLLWGLYRNRVGIASIKASQSGVAVPAESVEKVATCAKSLQAR